MSACGQTERCCQAAAAPFHGVVPILDLAMVEDGQAFVYRQ
jgi:hypothetical protein